MVICYHVFSLHGLNRPPQKAHCSTPGLYADTLEWPLSGENVGDKVQTGPVTNDQPHNSLRDTLTMLTTWQPERTRPPIKS